MWRLVVVMLVACGRVGFDGTPELRELSNGADTALLAEVGGALVVADGELVVDTDTGEIVGPAGQLRAPGTGVIAGIRYEAPATGVALFAIAELRIAASGALRARGSLPMVILVGTSATIAGTLDAGAGLCRDGTADPRCGGPGGGDGGFGTTPASGCAPGGRGDENGDTGGGGGGLGANGADGGQETGTDPGQTAAGGDIGAGSCPPGRLVPLRGGSGGGRAGGNGGGAGNGGGGGGAVQLSALDAIVVTGVIVAGGGGGRGALADAGGGGGGSGGAILVEATTVEITGIVAANGGGGGAGGSPDDGQSGGAGAQPAPGGVFDGVATYGADGGNGGAGDLPPARGGDDNRDTGGGGGAAGIIHVRGATCRLAAATLSPPATLACP